MNILVTGSEGFIGNTLVGKLKSKDNLIIGYGRGRNISYKTTNQPDIFVNGDISDMDKLRSIIADYEIEEIYHMAAKSIVKTCAMDPKSTFETNVIGTVNLLEACRVSGSTVKGIVISTSDKAFGHSKAPYNEESPLKPLYAYESSKACQQYVGICYAHNFGVPVKILASSNIYGPDDPNLSRIIPNTITRLIKGEKAMLNEGVENYVREFVYVDDAVNAFINVVKNGKLGEVYCCGGTEHLSIKCLIEKICNLMGKNPETNITRFKRPEQFKEIETQWIDSTKLRSLGWAPKYSLDEGLKKTIEGYADYLKNER